MKTTTTPQLEILRDAAPQADAQPLGELLARVQKFLAQFIVFSAPAQSPVLALWIAHTHALDAFDYTPYLHIHSPEKRCGKSRLLDCVELLIPKPWLCIMPSEAVLYRRISDGAVTLLLDEVDAIFTGGRSDESKEGLRAALNAGFERGKKVPRCVGANHQVMDFEVFCPKALAGIGKLPTTIADRAIPIRLVRRTRDEMVERFRKREVAPNGEAICAELAAWSAALEVIQSLREARPEIPDALGDRQADISEPLLAIADMAGGDWPAKAREALLEILTGKDANDDSAGVLLLAAMREIFRELDTDRIPTEQTVRALIERDDGPWAAWWGNDVDAGKIRGPGAKLAKMLRPFDIVPGSIRLADGTTPKGYKVEAFADAWAHYLPPLGNAATTPRCPE